MRKVLTVFAMAGVFAALGLAESWNGKLLDASCYDKQKLAKDCDASSATAAFALDVAGQIYSLDAEGNKKAAAALKSRADRSAPGKPTDTTVQAKITGSMEGTVLKVETVEIP